MMRKVIKKDNDLRRRTREKEIVDKKREEIVRLKNVQKSQKKESFVGEVKRKYIEDHAERDRQMEKKRKSAE